MTQKERIMRHLRDHGSITSWEAYSEYGITQLGARIWELKQKGIEFDTKLVRGKNRYEEPIHWYEYKLKA